MGRCAGSGSRCRRPKGTRCSGVTTTVDLRERIGHGQIISRYTVEGRGDADWQILSRGGTIGYRKLDRLAPVRVRTVRFTIADALDAPGPIDLLLYP